MTRSITAGQFLLVKDLMTLNRKDERIRLALEELAVGNTKAALLS